MSENCKRLRKGWIVYSEFARYLHAFCQKNELTPEFQHYIVAILNNSGHNSTFNIYSFISEQEAVIKTRELINSHLGIVSIEIFTNFRIPSYYEIPTNRYTAVDIDPDADNVHRRETIDELVSKAHDLLRPV